MTSIRSDMSSDGHQRLFSHLPLRLRNPFAICKMFGDLRLLIFLVTTFLVFIPSDGRKGKKCSFDSTWEGRWFESGERDEVRISTENITHKGLCLYKEGEKYIFKDKNKGCLRCAVMHQKHFNVIQYKESLCEFGYEHHPMNLCYNIQTDEPLKSLFRLEAEPIPCPIRGSFQFEYSRGHGHCSYPLSSISQCSDKSKLIFRNQACADIKGSESSVEELKCVADWKEGSTYYFLGVMNVSHVQSDNYEGRFRCFVYESNYNGYFLSQSGEAKCNLYTAREGAKTMKLKKIHNHQQTCEIPRWVLQDHHQFQDLSYASTYHFNKKGTSLTITPKGSSHETRRLKCNTVDMDNGNKTRIIMQVSFECENGYMCMEIHKKVSNILELRIGRLSRNPDEACHQQLFFDSSIQSTLLIGSGHGRTPCPIVGKYRALESNGGECVHRDDYLISGCSGTSALEMLKNCGERDEFESYSCQGNWNVGSRSEETYFILSSTSRSSKGSKRLCALLLPENRGTHEELVGHHFRNSSFTQDRIRLRASTTSCPVGLLAESNENPSENGKNVWDLSLERTSHCAQALATANTNAGNRFTLPISLLRVLGGSIIWVLPRL